ncbi:hypothetical protein ABZ319_22575 [Nocardia sp. NPDC005978]|uniref:hypothetical protein n=1 Tax=Nocardia sp. NPDC005978 TaxID=3156725 RepID=UPI0033A0CCA8
MAWFESDPFDAKARIDTRCVTHFDAVDVFAKLLNSAFSAGMSLRDLLESTGRFALVDVPTLVDEPGADVIALRGGRVTYYSEKHREIPAYGFTLSRILKVRTDIGPGWEQPGPYLHTISTGLLCFPDDSAGTSAWFTGSWRPDGDIPFDSWVRTLLEQPEVARLYDHRARLYAVTITSENPSAGVDAVSPNDVWRFTGGVLHTRTTRAELPEVDWFERWTYAEFQGDDQLVLALDTGQPFHIDGDGGSYGNRRGFIMVLQLGPDRRWELVAFESGLDDRSHDENFVPDAIAWHRRGVLAWSYKDEIDWHVYKSGHTRASRPEPRYAPDFDSNLGLVRHAGELYGAGHEMTLDESGRILTIGGADGTLFIDVDTNTRSTDGHTWETIPESLIYRFE